MKFRFALLAGALAAGLAAPVAAEAQESWPSKPIKIVVGFPPGVAGDILIRIIAPKLAEGLGQPVQIENKPGAGSSIGADMVVHAAPDGYTLYESSIANSVNHSVNKLTLHLARDLAPISLVADVPGLLAGHLAAPATLADLVAAAKARPDEFAYGSSGYGTATHLYGELLKLTAGIKLAHIPYKGSSQTLTDLLGGRIQVMFTPGATVLSNVQAGQIRAIAVIGRQRLATLPNVPTFAEAGIAGFESAFWFGLHAPAATPRPIIDRLNKEIARVIALPEVRAQFAAQSIEPVSCSVEEFAAFIRNDIDKWARVVKDAGVKAE